MHDVVLRHHADTTAQRLDDLFREGHGLGSGVAATVVLVETLLDRGAESDVVQAEAAIERLAAAPADESLVMRDIWPWVRIPPPRPRKLLV